MSQNKRKVISLELKLDVIKRFKSGEKAVDIGRALGLAPTTVRTICNRDCDKINHLAEIATPLQTKQDTIARNPLLVKMESLLSIWIHGQNKRRMPLSKELIKNKALSIYCDLKKNAPSSSNGNSEDFEASNGWFSRFKTRANLHNVALKGESASADTEASEKFKVELKAIIENGGYSSKQILNADETGLFWKRLPSRTYLSKNEKSCPGHKAAKDRLTLLLGGNAEGDFKFKPFLIYQSENPRAMKNINKKDLPVHWRANKKAWMTATLFKDWLENCAIPEFKSYCSSQQIEFKMLLLVDNAPGHPIFSDDLSENVKVVFMPPNTTSLIQPMDQGVISNFKMYYLRRTFRQLLETTEKNDELSMKDFWKNYNIVKAIENIHLSWDEVKVTSMKGSWRQLWPECYNGDENCANDIQNICNELVNLAREAEFEGMQEVDINELLVSHDEELDNEHLLSMDIEYALEEDVTISDDTVEEKKLTIANISKAMQLISQALDIFAENDPDDNRSTRVAASVDEAISCYKEIYQQKKSLKVQQTLDGFVNKKVRPPNQMDLNFIDLDLSSEESLT